MARYYQERGPPFHRKLIGGVWYDLDKSFKRKADARDRASRLKNWTPSRHVRVLKVRGMWRVYTFGGPRI